jgi:hypothetical protein
VKLFAATNYASAQLDWVVKYKHGFYLEKHCVLWPIVENMLRMHYLWPRRQSTTPFLFWKDSSNTKRQNLQPLLRPGRCHVVVITTNQILKIVENTLKFKQTQLLPRLISGRPKAFSCSANMRKSKNGCGQMTCP